jgi:magnesium-transporting ATPase (P-type)
MAGALPRPPADMSMYDETPMPYQTPAIDTPPPPMKVEYRASPIFSNTVVLSVVIIGIILIFVGMMVITSIIFKKDPSSDEMTNTVGGGRIVLLTGGMLTCLAFFGGAINNEILDIKIKVAFISAGISFMISTMIVLIFMGLLSL